jgi:zinc protease
MTAPSNSSVLSTRDVRRTILDNGLVVLTRESHRSPTVNSMIWYGVGSSDEVAGHTGSSHFLEHMLFKGTARYGKGIIDLVTMKNGGSNNAFTSYDFTAYYFSFASDRWETAIDIESDRMIHTIFDPAEFEAEKNVVIEELKSGLDQPWGKLMQELSRTAFEQHTYRNPVIGWLPDVEAATPSAMEAHYRKYYQPSNATLVLVGDFDTDHALDRVRSAFGQIPAGQSQPRQTLPEPQQNGERRVDVRWRSEVPRMAIAYHTPAIGHPDSYALQLLSVALAEGKASRFYQRLVEREASTTFMSAEYGESRDPTLFYVRGEGCGDGPPEAIEASVHDELSRIGTEGITEDELERAKHQIEAHFVFSLERTLDQAMLLGQIETLAELSYIDQYLSHVASVDTAAVADVCRKYLCESNRTVAWLLPEEDGR